MPKVTPLLRKKLANGCQNAPRKSIRRCTVSSCAAGSRLSRVASSGNAISTAMPRYATFQPAKSAR